MKKLFILMLMLMGVSAFAQKPRFIIVKTYKNGKATVSKVIPIAAAPQPVIVPVVKVKPKIKTITKTIQVPVERIVYKESIKYDTVKISVEKIVEKQVIKNIPFETIVEKIVEKRIETPPTRNIYLGPNAIVTDRNVVHGLGLSALIKNKHGEIFQINGGMIMREGLIAPTPYISLGAFIKIK
jgi:hypothetical protein